MTVCSPPAVANGRKAVTSIYSVPRFVNRSNSVTLINGSWELIAIAGGRAYRRAKEEVLRVQGRRPVPGLRQHPGLAPHRLPRRVPRPLRGPASLGEAGGSARAGGDGGAP